MPGDQTRFVLPVQLTGRRYPQWQTRIAPTVDREHMAWDGQRFWTILNGSILGYQPGKTKSRTEDRWIGPITIPGRASALMCSGKDLWVSAQNGHVLRLDVDQLARTAREKGNVHSTDQWEAAYRTRVAQRRWQDHAAFLIGRHEWDAALKLIRRQKKSTKRTLYEATVLYYKGQPAESARLYGKIAENTKASPAERFFSRICQIEALYRGKQWKSLPAVIDALAVSYPSLKNEVQSGRLSRYKARAQKEAP